MSKDNIEGSKFDYHTIILYCYFMVELQNLNIIFKYILCYVYFYLNIKIFYMCFFNINWISSLYRIVEINLQIEKNYNRR